jgi:tetratricopeptide (TPR) repeat protein
MLEGKDNFFGDEEMLEAVSRFENMIRNKTNAYFDIEEFEDIIDYYIGNDDYNSALRATDLASRLHPSSTAIQLRRIQLLVDRGNPVEAFRLLERIEIIESKNPDVLFLKGKLLLYLNKPEEAKKLFRRSLDYSFTNHDEILLEIASVFDQFLYFELAAEYLTEAHMINPENKEVLYELAFSYEKMGKSLESIPFYNLFLDKEPFSETAWFNLGFNFNRLERYPEALEAFDFAIAINEGFAAAWFNKGNSLANMGRYTISIEMYQEFIRLEGENDQVLYYIGECYEKMEQFTEAGSYYQKSIDLNPLFADGYFGLSMIAFQSGQIMESTMYIDHAISIDEENSEYWFLKGKIEQKSEDHFGAALYFHKATQFDKQDTEAWFLQAWSLYRSGPVKEAIRVINRGIRLNPEDADLQYHKSALLLIDGKLQNGLNCFKKGWKFDSSLFGDLFEFYPELAGHDALLTLIDKLKKEHFEKH